VTAVVGRWYPLGLFDAVATALYASAGGYTQECQPMLETLAGPSPDGRKFDAVSQLLQRFPLALLFDDLGRTSRPAATSIPVSAKRSIGCAGPPSGVGCL
jgi:hypothetical protein